MLLSFPLKTLPLDVLFVFTNLIMVDQAFSKQDRYSFLLADPAMRQFNTSPGIRVKIINKALLRQLHAAATSFHVVFPSSSFSNIWLIQTAIPRNPDLKSMLSELFQALPSLRQLNISFDRLTDVSPDAFVWLEEQATHLRAVEILRIKYHVDSEQLEDWEVPNPWSPSLSVRQFLSKMKGLRTVVLRTPLIVALLNNSDNIGDLNDDNELAWVLSWANHLPLVQHVYLAHAFDDTIGDPGPWGSGRRTAFLKVEASDWKVKGWWPNETRLPIKSPYSNNLDSVDEHERDPYDSDT